MIAQGKELVVQNRGRKVEVYSLSSGMEKVIQVKSEREISAVGCCSRDRFFLIGCTDGTAWLFTAAIGQDKTLENGTELCKMSLRISSFCVVDDTVYVSSENGVVYVVLVEPRAYKEREEREEREERDNSSIIQESSLKGKEDSTVEDGWMKPIEAAETTVETESAWSDLSMQGQKYACRTVREIKHTTPLLDVKVSGKKVYVLDMRGRVKIFPSRVVYDHVSIILFKKYLLGADGNTLFAEVGDAFTSIYFAENEIKEIQSSSLGGYLFLLTDRKIEIVDMSGGKKKKVYSYAVEKEVEHLVVDSERAIVYGVCGDKIMRMNIEYVWLDKPMDDLIVRPSVIEKVRIKNKEAEEEREPFEAPAPFTARDMSLPQDITNLSEVKEREKLQPNQPNQLNSTEKAEIIELFTREENIDTKNSENINTMTNKINRSATEISIHNNSIHKELVKNGIVGPIFANEGKSTLLFRSPEVKAIACKNEEKTEIEISVAGSSINVSMIREKEEVVHLACSSKLLVLCNEEKIKIVESSNGVFQQLEKAQKYRVEIDTVKRVVCGHSFFCTIIQRGKEKEVCVFSSKSEEVYASAGDFIGVCASGKYLGLVYLTSFGGKRISLMRYREENAIIELVTSAEYNGGQLQSCNVNSEGVMVVEIDNGIYILGDKRLIYVMGAPKGIPIGLAGNHLLSIAQTGTGKPCLFPETLSHACIERISILGQKVNIYKQIQKEITKEVGRETTRENNIKYNTKYNSDLDNAMHRYASFSVERENNISNIHNKTKEEVVKKIQVPLTPTSAKIEENKRVELLTPTKKIERGNPFAKRQKKA